MELCNQVVSLELAKKLKEVGIEQDSLFYYSKSLDKYSIDCSICYDSTFDYPIFKDTYSAFTVAELGEILRNHPKLRTGYKQYIDSNAGYIFYDDDKKISINNDNEANCRAMWILHLLGEK